MTTVVSCSSDSECWFCVFVCSASVQLKFESLSEDDVLVDPQRKLPTLSFWLHKNNYNSQQALLWCLTRTSYTLIEKWWCSWPVGVFLWICTLRSLESEKQINVDECVRVLQAAMRSSSAPSPTSETPTLQVSSAARCIRTAESAERTTNLWDNPAAPCWTERPTTPTARRVNNNNNTAAAAQFSF